MIVILRLSDTDARALRDIPIELKALTAEVAGVRAASERIAAALEAQEAPRVPASVAWHHDSPTKE